MNKSNVKIIILLASVALLGLITIQGYWINNAILLGEQRFEQDVNDALNKVVSQMEKQMATTKINKKFNFRKQGIRWFTPQDSLTSFSKLINPAHTDNKNDYSLQKDKMNMKIYEEYSSDSNGVVVKKSRHKSYLNDSTESEMGMGSEVDIPTDIKQFNPKTAIILHKKALSIFLKYCDVNVPRANSGRLGRIIKNCSTEFFNIAFPHGNAITSADKVIRYKEVKMYLLQSKNK